MRAVEVVHRNAQGFTTRFATFTAEAIHAAMLAAGGMSTDLDTLTDAVMEVLDGPTRSRPQGAGRVS